MSKLNVKIVTPENTMYSGECDSVSVPVNDGYYGIMANHSPIAMALTKGNIKIKNDDEETVIPISGAVLCCKNNTVSVACK